jgi:hypothetical protein
VSWLESDGCDVTGEKSVILCGPLEAPRERHLLTHRSRLRQHQTVTNPVFRRYRRTNLAAGGYQ